MPVCRSPAWASAPIRSRGRRSPRRAATIAISGSSGPTRGKYRSRRLISSWRAATGCTTCRRSKPWRATLGAAVGASRVAVDDGRFSRDKQIGATGKTVSARGYIAVGISGAVQHLQGIKDCQHVIAVNRDAGAPIVGRADLSVIGDAEEVMQALLTRIAQARKQRELPEAP